MAEVARTPDHGVATARCHLIGNGAYVDRNGNHLVDAGDTVTVRFDRPVTLRSATPVAFQLPVPGDSFGDSASMERGDQDDEVRIVLGNGARLRARGHFAQNTAGSPSGIALVATDAIVGRDQQEPVAVGPARDIDAGFLFQVVSAGTDFQGSPPATSTAMATSISSPRGRIRGVRVPQQRRVTFVELRSASAVAGRWSWATSIATAISTS